MLDRPVRIHVQIELADLKRLAKIGKALDAESNSHTLRMLARMLTTKEGIAWLSKQVDSFRNVK